jgi:hypothetical protein
MENHNTPRHNNAKSNRNLREVPNGTNYEAMEGARAGSAARETNCQLVEISGGGKISFGSAGPAKDSSPGDDKVNRSNASVGAIANGVDSEKVYPPDLTQPHTHCSGVAGAWLELLPNLVLSQHANGLSTVIISSVQCAVQENQVPNSSRAKNDFSTPTLRMVWFPKNDSTPLLASRFFDRLHAALRIAVHSFAWRSRSAFAITETELKLIAAPAMMGLKSNPKNG